MYLIGGRGELDLKAEAGARLTCHLLLRLFKTIESPQPALYSVGMFIHRPILLLFYFSVKNNLVLKDLFLQVLHLIQCLLLQCNISV
jgi:hypothetical protein